LRRQVLGLPDEVLKEVALVLGKDQVLGLLNDIAQIGNKLLTIGGQLLGRRSQRCLSKGAVQGNIDLLVLDWKSAIESSTSMRMRQLTDGTLPLAKAVVEVKSASILRE